ncbi:MAG: DUF3667 domain-containing protein [Bacteroidia bacterium]
MAGYHYVPFGEYQCKNCNNNFEGIVCNNCGQHPVEEKLTLKVLWKEFKGRRAYDFRLLIKTIFSLIKSPGKVISEYLGGKRHAWYNAVNLFLLAGTLAAFVTIQTNGMHIEDAQNSAEAMQELMGTPQNEKSAEFSKKMYDWMQGHYNIVLLFALPVMALASWLVYRKRGYSLGEHVIMQCFTYGVFTIFTLPGLIVSNPFSMGGVYQYIMGALFFGWYFWVYKDLFKAPIVKTILVTIWWFILYFLLIFAASLVIGLVGAIVAILGILLMKKMGIEMDF